MVNYLKSRFHWTVLQTGCWTKSRRMKSCHRWASGLPEESSRSRRAKSTRGRPRWRGWRWTCPSSSCRSPSAPLAPKKKKIFKCKCSYCQSDTKHRAWSGSSLAERCDMLLLLLCSNTIFLSCSTYMHAWKAFHLFEQRTLTIGRGKYRYGWPPVWLVWIWQNK